MKLFRQFIWLAFIMVGVFYVSSEFICTEPPESTYASVFQYINPQKTQPEFCAHKMIMSVGIRLGIYQEPKSWTTVVIDFIYEACEDIAYKIGLYERPKSNIELIKSYLVEIVETYVVPVSENCYSIISDCMQCVYSKACDLFSNFVSTTMDLILSTMDLISKYTNYECGEKVSCPCDCNKVLNNNMDESHNYAQVDSQSHTKVNNKQLDQHFSRRQTTTATEKCINIYNVIVYYQPENNQEVRENHVQSFMVSILQFPGHITYALQSLKMSLRTGTNEMTVYEYYFTGEGNTVRTMGGYEKGMAPKTPQQLNELQPVKTTGHMLAPDQHTGQTSNAVLTLNENVKTEPNVRDKAKETVKQGQSIWRGYDWIRNIFHVNDLYNGGDFYYLKYPLEKLIVFICAYFLLVFCELILFLSLPYVIYMIVTLAYDDYLRSRFDRELREIDKKRFVRSLH